MRHIDCKGVGIILRPTQGEGVRGSEMEAISKTVFLMVMMVLALAVGGLIWFTHTVGSLIPEPYGRPIDKGW